MTTANRLTDTMKEQSEAELIDILTSFRNDYQPDAIIAAELELKNRNLSTDKIEQAKKEVVQKHEDIKTKANEPLEISSKILVFLLPGIPSLIFSLIYKGEGHDRKFRETWRWTFYGIGFYILLVIGLSVVMGSIYD